MIITSTGFACILLAFFLFLKERKKALLDPRLIILVSYFAFWGRIFDSEYNFYYDILLFASFLIFYGIVNFMYKKDLMFSRKLVSMLPVESRGEPRPLSKKMRAFLYVFIASCIALNLFYYTIVFGSLEAALIRFYGRPPEIETKSIYETGQILLFLASLLGLTMLHYSNRKFGKNDPPLFYVCWLGLILIAFSGGSRGRVLLPVVLIFISEIFISIKENRPLIKNFFRIPYIAIILISLVLVLFLTENRNENFFDKDEALAELQSGRYLFAEQNNQDSGISLEKDLMMNDYYLTMETFPAKEDYLSFFSSVYTVLVNPVPRFLWPNKPVGFGRRLAAVKENYDHTDNELIATQVLTGYAVGIHGEGYANGGLAGMFFYTILLGLVSALFANIYKEMFRYDSCLSFLLCLALLVIPACYIRGDILAGVSQFIFPIVGLFVCLIIFKKLFIRKSSGNVTPE